ncbi:hypothetical protein ABC383_10570 [Noviherbaspirillum sp. 1P10PC]|uniref:hypothetical protein n=1 Tax=Noviherbaspirillum sp. 1P10PC TaxID=3132292 RepID=UPI0039A2F5CF
MSKYLPQNTTLQTLEGRKARMMAKAMRDIFSGTEWLTSEQAAARGMAVASTRVMLKAGCARINRWKAEKKIFAVQREGTDWYPRYQFDDDFTPVPIIKEVVHKFSASSPIEIAAWMESPNNYLDGKRPREMLRSQKSAVLNALVMHFDDAAPTATDIGS